MTNKQEIGSKTAKAGFENERNIAEKFRNWIEDKDAQDWLTAMRYNLNNIEDVQAEIVSGNKTDVRVQIQVKTKRTLETQNIQVKLVSGKHGFNQIDKRWVDSYKEIWKMPNDVAKILKHYTGELPPYIEGAKDNRRMNLNEFTESEKNLVVEWFEKNRFLVFTDVFRGRGKYSVEWVMTAQKYDGIMRWTIKNINDLMNYLEGEVSISAKGVLYIGSNLSMQRKGGDRGRRSANMLQFKSDPVKFFDA